MAQFVPHILANNYQPLSAALYFRHKMELFVSKLICLLICIFLYSSAALSAEKEWPIGSAMWTIQEEQKEKAILKEKTDLLMEEIYLQLALKYQIDAVKELLKSWEMYSWRSCRIVGITSGSGGSWPSANAAGCETKLKEKQYIFVQAALQCMKKITPAQIGVGVQKISCFKPVLIMEPQ